MNTYLCELILNGIVVKSFYRAGDAPEDVLSGLELFEWPLGDWVIEPMGDPIETNDIMEFFGYK